MGTTKISEDDMHRDCGNYVETDDFFMAKEKDKNGAYIDFIKTSAIMKKPENEYEREEMFQAGFERSR